jgi:ubiquinone/menaquinone biosynthesis C-methylase UbiE
VESWSGVLPPFSSEWSGRFELQEVFALRILHWLKKTLQVPKGGSDARVPPAEAEPALRERVIATQSAGFYDQAYFDKPKDVCSESGYAGYTPQEPGIGPAADIITTYFDPQRVLDVGCAKGYVVDKLRQKGIDAWGIDFSRYAIEAAPESVKDYVAVGDVLDIQFPDDAFDLVACIETLEHLTPDRTARAIAELYRVTSDKLWVTTPSMGVNDFGPPDGWPQGKVREDVMPQYAANRDFPDPAPVENLMLDKDGYPIHGHLTVASFRWWTEMLTQHGFVRRGDVEMQINRDQELVRTGQWSSYVFEKPHIVADAEAWMEQLSAVTQLADCPFGSDIGEVTACPWKPKERVQMAAAGSPTGLLLHGPRAPLPPGWYEVEFHLGVQGIEAVANEWAEVAVIDVRSSDRQKIHALRTVRRRDFAVAGPQTFTLAFASSGEPDFEFRVWFSGSCGLLVASKPVVRPLQLPPARTSQAEQEDDAPLPPFREQKEEKLKSRPKNRRVRRVLKHAVEKRSHEYRRTWDQLASSSAMYSIYATSDQEQFERGGKNDAEQIGQWVTPDSVVLDVGCGIGRVEKYLALYCRELYAVDVSAEMLRQAQERLAELSNVSLHHASATDLSFAQDGMFDFVFSLLVLQHMEKEDAFLSLREICRVLKPGGLAYLQFPSLFADVYFQAFVQSAEMTDRPVHRMRLYTPQEVAFLLDKAGFDIEEQLNEEVEILMLARKREEPHN